MVCLLSSKSGSIRAIKCCIYLEKLKVVFLRHCASRWADQLVRLHLFPPHMEVFFSHEVLHFACIFTTALLGPWPLIPSLCGLGPLYSGESSHASLAVLQVF